MISFHSLKIEQWGLVHEALGLRWVEDTRGIWAVRDNAPVALCVLQNWTQSSVCAHLWVGNPMVLRHGFFEEVADFVFNKAGMYTMIGMVPANNEKALKLNKHIGLSELCRIPDGFSPGEDWVIMTANRESLSRWLGDEDGFEERSRSA